MMEWQSAEMAAKRVRESGLTEVRTKLEELDRDRNLRHYFRSYCSLVKISGFLCAEARRRNDASFSGQAIIAIAQMAYGWMPTMLNQANIIKSAKHEDWCAFFDAADANGFDDAIAFIDRYESSPIGATWVGASKVLHFVNPKVFPIWDSNVARALASEDCKNHHYHTSPLAPRRGAAIDFRNGGAHALEWMRRTRGRHALRRP